MSALQTEKAPRRVPETWETTGLLGLRAALRLRMELLPKERKLLLLALDRAAHAGEAENAAIAFMRSLKGRFGDGHQLLRELEGQQVSSRYSSGVDYGHTILPFGKYRGQDTEVEPDDIPF